MVVLGTRITVAIRMAAAKEETFDNVVMSNDRKSYLQVNTWSTALRGASK